MWTNAYFNPGCGHLMHTYIRRKRPWLTCVQLRPQLRISTRHVSVPRNWYNNAQHIIELQQPFKQRHVRPSVLNHHARHRKVVDHIKNGRSGKRNNSCRLQTTTHTRLRNFQNSTKLFTFLDMARLASSLMASVYSGSRILRNDHIDVKLWSPPMSFVHNDGNLWHQVI